MRPVAILRRDARLIFAAALQAADAGAALKNCARCANGIFEVGALRYDLSRYRDVYVVGAGKASGRMAQALELLLAARITAGAVAVKHGYGATAAKIAILEAAHPIPDLAGLAAADDVLDLANRANENDLVICLLSGGGSALLPSPRAGLSLADKQRTTGLLLNCGATIQEVNAVRKHLSQMKGGGLARCAYPATVLTLILSDVIGDSIETIASGPTAPDPSTFADCERIVKRYELWDRVPSAVREAIQDGIEGRLAETLKPGDPVFDKVTHLIIGNNSLATEAAREKARALGYESRVLSNSIAGEARDAAAFHTALAHEIAKSRAATEAPVCLISGGETTVTVRGAGTGGRNQEFALAAALEIDGDEGMVVLSAGTDGTDGPTDAAGGVVDGGTARRARRKGFDGRSFLDDNNAYEFLSATGDLLITGATFTNVMDLQVILIG